MGKIEDGYIRGLVGSVISRRVGNLNVVQGRAQFRVKRTEATKAAGVDFGTASSCARMIRRAFWTLILEYHDGGMINRLNAQVLRAMRANRSQQPGSMQLAAGRLHRLADFQFNDKSHLQDYLFVDIQVDHSTPGSLDIVIPAFHSERDLLWSGDVTHCTIQLRVFAFDFEKEEYQCMRKDQLLISLREREKEVPQQHWHLDLDKPPGTVILVGLSLEFMRWMGHRHHLFNDKNFHPAALVGAFVV
ncbi:hypothetical protein [Parapedobacter sp. DT-150]|uniref:hypothetical protein n=1 Tax=Parapedobacter sp. DT-150 TaxID=3396162 RepID=UPI003F1987A1